jgi:hypothetical protein
MSTYPPADMLAHMIVIGICTETWQAVHSRWNIPGGTDEDLTALPA